MNSRRIDKINFQLIQHNSANAHSIPKNAGRKAARFMGGIRLIHAEPPESQSNFGFVPRGTFLSESHCDPPGMPVHGGQNHELPIE